MLFMASLRAIGAAKAPSARRARMYGFARTRDYRGKIASSCVAVNGADAKATNQLM